MSEMTVATVQMEPQLGQLEENLVKMGEFITRIATEQHVDLIVFPELVTTGYEIGPRFPNMAQRVPGPTVNIISQRASEMGVHIIFGMVTKDKVESILYDSAILIGPDGDLIHQYDKVHLRGEEQIAFRPGYKIKAAETGLGVIGMMVDWDLTFPEVARCLVLDGAEILTVSANWEQPYSGEWRTYLKARAYENNAFIIAANRVGEEPSYTFFGQSSIVGPNGKVYATIEDPVEGYAVAQINLDDVRRRREESQILQCRQPASYRAVSRKY